VTAAAIVLGLLVAVTAFLALLHLPVRPVPYAVRMPPYDLWWLNYVATRNEERVAMTVVRPERFVIVTTF
jgi:hypothetical protein